MRCRTFLILLVLSIPSLAFAAGAGSGEERCPVMPSEMASPQFSVQYGGRTVRLCCAKCVRKFTAEPTKYVEHLPASPAAGAPAPLAPSVVPAPSQLVNEVRPLLVVIAGILLAYVVAARFTAGGSHVTGPRRFLAPVGRHSTLLLVLVAALATAVLRYAAGIEGARQAVAAAETRSDAVVREFETVSRFAGEMTRQGIEQGPDITGSLDATYYRGNDERDPGLFNNGKYRTVTFRVALEDSGGARLRPAESVTGRDLFVRIEVRRAPFTADAFFARESMRRVRFYARAAEPLLAPLASRLAPVEGLPLTVVKADWLWEVRFPIGRIGGSGIVDHSGVILFCPDTGSGPVHAAWTDAHYGIQYRLRAEGGTLMPSSRLWMSSLYFSVCKNDDERGAWFNFRPIPELPGPNTTDKHLLGLDKLKAREPR